MTGAFFMVQIVFLIETIAQAKAKVIGSAEMGHESKLGVNVVVKLIACSDFLVDIAFAERDVIVF